MSTPMRRVRSRCCARAAIGHAVAAPPSSVMASRLFNRDQSRIFVAVMRHRREPLAAQLLPRYERRPRRF
jgi:hypothetical protein